MVLLALPPGACQGAGRGQHYPPEPYRRCLAGRRPRRDPVLSHQLPAARDRDSNLTFIGTAKHDGDGAGVQLARCGGGRAPSSPRPPVRRGGQRRCDPCTGGTTRSCSPASCRISPSPRTIRIGGRDGDAPPRAVALATAHPDVNYRVAGEPALDPERLVCVWNPIAHGVLLLDCSMG
jgi:hypothetical protein